MCGHHLPTYPHSLYFQLLLRVCHIGYRVVSFCTPNLPNEHGLLLHQTLIGILGQSTKRVRFITWRTMANKNNGHFSTSYLMCASVPSVYLGAAHASPQWRQGRNTSHCWWCSSNQVRTGSACFHVMALHKRGSPRASVVRQWRQDSSRTVASKEDFQLPKYSMPRDLIHPVQWT